MGALGDLAPLVCLVGLLIFLVVPEAPPPRRTAIRWVGMVMFACGLLAVLGRYGDRGLFR